MLNDRTDTIAISLKVGREENVGINRLLQLLDASPRIQFPAAAKEVCVAEITFDACAGILANAYTKAHIERRTFTQTDVDRHRYRVVGFVRYGRLRPRSYQWIKLKLDAD